MLAAAIKENYKGQITFFASEVFAEVCQQLGAADKSPGVTRRNVITRGVDLNSLVGRHFCIQGIEFEGVAMLGEATTVSAQLGWMDARYDEFVDPRVVLK